MNAVNIEGNRQGYKPISRAGYVLYANILKIHSPMPPVESITPDINHATDETLHHWKRKENENKKENQRMPSFHLSLCSAKHILGSPSTATTPFERPGKQLLLRIAVVLGREQHAACRCLLR